MVAGGGIARFLLDPWQARCFRLRFFRIVTDCGIILWFPAKEMRERTEKNQRHRFSVLLHMGVLAPAFEAAKANESGSTDRVCLEDAASPYPAATVAQGPSEAPFAKSFCDPFLIQEIAVPMNPGPKRTEPLNSCAFACSASVYA
jgi:hypothetical protein